MFTEDSVISNAPSIVNTTYVIYNMEPVLLVIQGGPEQGVQKVRYIQATLRKVIINMHDNKETTLLKVINNMHDNKTGEKKIIILLCGMMKHFSISILKQF